MTRSHLGSVRNLELQFEEAAGAKVVEDTQCTAVNRVSNKPYFSLLHAIVRIYSPLYFVNGQLIFGRKSLLYMRDIALLKPTKLHRQNQYFYFAEKVNSFPSAAVIC